MHHDYIEQDKDDKDINIYQKFLHDSNLQGMLGKFGSYPLLEILQCFDEYKSKYKMSFCAVCSNKLTDNELSKIEPSHFNICCDKHKEYRIKFQIL